MNNNNEPIKDFLTHACLLNAYENNFEEFFKVLQMYYKYNFNTELHILTESTPKELVNEDTEERLYVVHDQNNNHIYGVDHLECLPQVPTIEELAWWYGELLNGKLMK